MHDDTILSRMMAEAGEELDEMRQGPERNTAAARFLSRLLHIGLRLHRSPSLSQRQDVQSFLHSCEAPLLHAVGGVERYARALAEMNEEPWEVSTGWGPFSVDRWSGVCSQRSALQFVLDFFPDLFESSAYLRELLAEADEHFKRKVEAGEATPHPNEVPAGAPIEHWWWRCSGE